MPPTQHQSLLSRQQIPTTINPLRLVLDRSHSYSRRSFVSAPSDGMASVFNQNSFNQQGTTPGSGYQGTTLTHQLAHPQQTHNQYASPFGFTGVLSRDDLQTQQFHRPYPDFGHAPAMQPMGVAFGAWPSQTPVALMTVYPQNNQLGYHAPQGQAYGECRQSLPPTAYVNRMAAEVPRGGSNTQYLLSRPRHPHGPRHAGNIRRAQGMPRSVRNDNARNQSQHQNQVLGTVSMRAQSPDIYNRSVQVDSSGGYQTSLNDSVIAPPSFNGTILAQGHLTLVTSQSEVATGQIGTIDTQPAHSMNTAMGTVSHSSDFEDGVDVAVLNHVSGYVNATPPTSVPARTSPQVHKRKHSGQSDLSNAQKEARRDKVAERRRIAAEREAAEPPISEEELKRRRYLDAIEAKVRANEAIQEASRRQPLTSEELRIYLPAEEVQLLRAQSDDLLDLHHLSDDEFRRKYVEEKADFFIEAGAWRTQQREERDAQKKVKRQMKRIAK